LRLADLRYDTVAGRLVAPDLGHTTAPETALAGYLAEGRELLLAAPEWDGTAAAGALSADFERLRWFDLPAASLVAADAG
jgi:hypothetical protein